MTRFTRSITNWDESNRSKGNCKVLSGLTHPPSSYRWRFPLHRVVCYLGSPRDNRENNGTLDLLIFDIPHLTPFYFSCNPLCFHLPHLFSPLPSCSFTSFPTISTIFSSFAFPLTRLSLCSLLVQASMKVWAMTESEASTTSDTWTSKMKWGFLRMFTQNRRGRLYRKKSKKMVFRRGCYCFRIQENLINWVREAFHLREHLPEVQLSAVQDNNRDGEKPFLYVPVYSEQYSPLSLYITISYDTDLCENYCCSMKMKWKK